MVNHCNRKKGPAQKMRLHEATKIPTTLNSSRQGVDEYSIILVYCVQWIAGVPRV